MATTTRSVPRAQGLAVQVSRIERLRATFDSLGVESFLVSNPVNVRYLTGPRAPTPSCSEGEQVLVLTDIGAIEAARGVEGAEAVLVDRDCSARPRHCRP